MKKVIGFSILLTQQTAFPASAIIWVRLICNVFSLQACQFF
jgi:hypothetical protein